MFDVEGFSEGDPDGAGGQPIRLRITLQPPIGSRTRVHVRGLNCFVQRAEGIPTLGIDVADDMELDLVTPDRRRLAGVRFAPGDRSGDTWTIRMPDVCLTVPASRAEDILVLRFSSSTELTLIHKKPKE